MEDFADGSIGGRVEPGLGGKITTDPDLAVERKFETLDEPVSDTILRDVRRVGKKIKHVLFPRDSDKSLNDWDLWGPLFLCLLLASTMSWGAHESEKALVFAMVFILVWCGAGVITLNAALLGGKISFLQSVCVLGYCIFPLNVASFLCIVGGVIFRSLVCLIALVWSTKASVGFMRDLVPAEKRALALFPVMLFYLTISWMILVNSG